MKKLILTALVLSLVVSVQAQGTPERKKEMPGMQERRGGHHGIDFKALNLTDDQKAQFKTQRESYRKQMDELKKTDNITVKEWRSRMETLRKDQQTKMQSIFTPEQKQQMEKMRAEGKAKHEAMAKGMAEKMKTNLGLSDEQSARISKNREEMMAKIKTIREDNSMNMEQKKEEMKKLHEQNKEQMKSILTEDQLKKLKETKKERPERQKVI